METMGEDFYSVGTRNTIVKYILDKTEFDIQELKDGGEIEVRTEMGVERMVSGGFLTGAFPLHDGEYKAQASSEKDHWIKLKNQLTTRQKLYYTWASPKAWYKKQPMDPIRRYFGEKIALYFSWLGFYTQWLLGATIVGMIVFIVGLCNMNSDPAVAAACNDGLNANWIMCPQCEDPCTFWLFSDACVNIRLSYLVNNKLTVPFAIFMALWATLFLEFWKRREATCQFEWDLFDFEDDQEYLRPEFENLARKNKESWFKESKVTQSLEPFMPFNIRAPRLLASYATILFMILLVVACVVGVVVYRVIILGVMSDSSSGAIKSQASTATSGTGAALNLVAIMIFSIIYNKIAVFLTDLECPRTDTEYEDSYTVKMFAFQFVNFYSSIAYIAFFKGKFVGYPGNYATIFGYRLEECQPGGCLMELTVQLAIVMIGKQFINNLQEIAIPIVSEYMKTRKMKKEEAKRASMLQASGEGTGVVNEIDTQWEKDYLLSPQPKMNLFGEYLEMVIQFGFATLFASSFPLAPFFAFVNNVIEIRLDGFKFISQLQRPWAQKAQDLGSWFGILNVVAVLAVLFNAVTIAFTSTYVDALVYDKTVPSSQQAMDTFWNFTFTSTDATKNFPGYPCEQNVIDEYFPDLKKGDDCPVTVCYYQGYRHGVNAKAPNQPGDLTADFWHVLASRLLFIIIFEHLIFFVKAVVMYIVPDMPGDVKVQMLRQEHVVKTELFEKSGKTKKTAAKAHDADDYQPMATGPTPTERKESQEETDS